MPAGVPKEAAASLETTLKKLHDTRTWKDFAAKNMYEDKYLNSADFAAYLQKRSAELKEFLLAVGAIKKP